MALSRVVVSVLVVIVGMTFLLVVMNFDESSERSSICKTRSSSSWSGSKWWIVAGFPCRCPRVVAARIPWIS